ncbi:MAG: hypothetical protein IPI78_14695 [Chitinophagaceae bacterium]|nr:hypothetical protein [Chitinophagaceae bacterium]
MSRFLQKDSSEGRINYYNLLNSINNPSLQFTVEKVNVPDQPFRTLIQYKNINTLYLRIVKADDNLKKLLETQYDNRFWTAIADAKADKSWQQNYQPQMICKHIVQN